MEAPTYVEVFAYAGQVERTGSYSREQMESILSARYLYGQEWLPHLVGKGPDALAELKQSKRDAATWRAYFCRQLSLFRCLFNWLMGEEFDEVHETIRDVVCNLYPNERDVPARDLAQESRATSQSISIDVLGANVEQTKPA